MNGTMEMLNHYRALVLEIEELERQLEMAAPSGKPAGCKSISAGGMLPSTNDPMAAAMQLADGIEARIRQRREELAGMNPQMFAVVSGICDVRMMMIVQHYYLMAETDEQVGRYLGLSTGRVNQIRNRYLQRCSMAS